MSKIIELKKVNKWFDKFQALKDINLEVNQQEKIVICGPSGSGKSTLIRCINRLEEHQDDKSVRSYTAHVHQHTTPTGLSIRRWPFAGHE